MNPFLLYFLIGLVVAVAYRLYFKRKQSILTLILAMLLWPILPVFVVGMVFLVILSKVVVFLSKVKV